MKKIAFDLSIMLAVTALFLFVSHVLVLTIAGAMIIFGFCILLFTRTPS